MSLVLLETNSESLVDILLWVHKLKENFAALREAGDVKRWSLCVNLGKILAQLVWSVGIFHFNV